MAFNTTQEIIEDIRQGRMVVIMDDEARENEGDLVMAAPCVRPEDVNFMAKYGRGLICLTLTPERCKQLNLPLMVRDTHFTHATNFTVSIEAAHGVTTGISAADRAQTIRAAVAKDARPADLVQPGHIFPLMAQPGGVLTRAGHTEAGCDLARLAGFEPASVIVEILNDDGSMARRADLEIFAREHGLKMGSIADLIRFRIQNEKTVERVAESALTTEFGDFRLVLYRDSVQAQLHMALVKGKVDPRLPTLVRVHIANPVLDLTWAVEGDSGWPLRGVLQRVAEEPSGVVVILNNQIDAAELVRQVKGRHGAEGVGGGQELPQKPDTEDLRTIGLGAQIVADLGVRRMRVLSAPKRIHALSGFGLEVVEYVG